MLKDIDYHNLKVENAIIKEGFEDIKAELAWLQSQVIVLEEGAEPQEGDLLTDGGYLAFIRDGKASILHDTAYTHYKANGDYPLVTLTSCKILARICPIEGKLKAVVYKKGAGI